MTTKAKKRCEHYLRVISLGKYQTTLYNKNGSAFQSSALGGIMTILAMAVIGIAILFQLIAVFSQSHYNLDIEGLRIEGYYIDDNNTLHANTTNCKQCIAITMRDYP